MAYLAQHVQQRVISYCYDVNRSFCYTFIHLLDDIQIVITQVKVNTGSYFRESVQTLANYVANIRCQSCKASQQMATTYCRLYHYINIFTCSTSLGHLQGPLHSGMPEITDHHHKSS